MLAVLPFFHIFALTAVMNVSIARGSTLVALPRFDFEAVMAAIRRCRPTVFPGVPTLFKALLDKGATAEDLSSLRSCVSGGAPLPAQVKEDFEARSGCSVTEGYGLTEASPVCFSNPPGEGNRVRHHRPARARHAGPRSARWTTLRRPCRWARRASSAWPGRR